MKKNLKVLLIIIFVVGAFLTYKNYDGSKVIGSSTSNKDDAGIKNLENREKYLSCMAEPYKSESLDEDFNELFEEYKNKGVAIYFTELNNNYSYSLNETKTYYSASVVKLFDAIYLIEQAKKGEIDLNDTITYLPSDKRAGSHKTDEHKYYDEIPVKDLINYAISVSDNAAHYMLVKYIDAKALNLYFKNNGDISLGLSNSKPFSYNYTATMANESLKRAYTIIKDDDEYGKLLKDAMDNDYTNVLNFDEVKVLHKYGWYADYFHDLGIYDSDDPYFISILTMYGNSNYEQKLQAIHKKIHEIYQKNLDSKRAKCLNQAI